MNGESVEGQIRDIFQEFHQDVYRFLIYFTRNRNDAEDLTQEVFIRVLKALPRFEQRSQIKTWILSIAKNVAVDYHRKAKVRTLFQQLQLATEERSSPKGQPELELESSERKRRVEEAILQLKPKYRMVVILRGIKELSIKETASVLECSEIKVKVHYHRALKMLQDILQAEDEGGDVYGTAK